MRFVWWFLGLLVAGTVAWFAIFLTWSYSSGERAGWVQKFSNKGWVCKTWEGELAMVTNPGASPEKFYFTVWDDATAEQINKFVGKRVVLHYEQKTGLPTTCFGETRHWVTRVTLVDDIPLVPGYVVPQVQVPVKPGEAMPVTPTPAVPGTPPATPGAPAAPAAMPTPPPPPAVPAAPAPAK